MEGKTLAEIARTVGGELIGDPDKVIAGVASVGDCRPDEITFANDPVFVERACKKGVGALLVPSRVEGFSAAQIVVADPKIAALQVAYLFAPTAEIKPGRSTSAWVEETARIDPTATLMPFAYVGPDAKVGPGTVIHPGAYVGRQASVGAQCTLFPNAVVGERCVVGDRVILHGNAVLGTDGFGFYPDEQGRHQKIPQLGIVVVGDDVEIGACSCVDRATFGRTVIGEGTKIDNLVQIGHNCLIGKNALLVSQVGLAGSVEVEDQVTFAARSGSVGHVTIGQGAIIGGLSVVINDVEPGARLGGFPARHHMDWKRTTIAVEKLPQALKTLRRLEKRVAELENKRGKE